MLANPGAFSHLESLDLGLVWDVLSPDDGAALDKLCATVKYRYLSPA